MQVDGNAVKEIFKILKAPYVLLTLALASGLILFLPNNIIEKMYMTNFRSNFGFVLGIIFLCSITLLIVLLMIKIGSKISNKYMSKKLNEKVTEFLMKMNNNTEIEVIKELLNEDDYTLELPVNNGVVIKLQHFNIITPAGNTHYVEMNNPTIPYFLQPYVMDIISGNESLSKKFGIKK